MLCSIYDLDLFSLNMGEAHNPDFNLHNHHIQSHCFSRHSSINSEVNFPDMLVTHVSLCSIIMSQVLGEILKTFRFIYEMSWIIILALLESNSHGKAMSFVVYIGNITPPMLSGVF